MSLGMSITKCLEKEKVSLKFTVTDSRKSFGGYTVYRIVLKFWGQDSTGNESGEVVLWKRYSEFRRLHRDLKSLFEKQNQPGHFPDFVGPKLFGRFDEHVIEERKQSALVLLSFVGQRKQLWSSDIFKNFMQSPINNSSGSSKSGSVSSGLNEDSSEGAATQTEGASLMPVVNGSAGNRTVDNSTPDGIWDCRQPTPEDDASICLQIDDVVIRESTLHEHPVSPELCEEVVYSETNFHLVNDPSHDEKPRTCALDRTDETDTTEVAVDVTEKSNDDVFSDDCDASWRQGEWLRHAFSVCSEGGDIEQLAAEAEDTNYPMPSPDLSPSAASRSGVFSFQEENCDSCKENPPKKHETEELSAFGDPAVSDGRRHTAKIANDINSNIRKTEAPLPEPLGIWDEVSTLSDELAVSHSRTATNNEETTISSTSTEDSNKDKGFLSCPDFAIGKEMAEVIEEVVEEDDYIYQASLAMSEAIEHESIGNYVTSFQLYKFGVGVLLHGVQQDENNSRREAVRRKTAQYLLKAETLYKTYLAGKDETQSAVQVNCTPSVKVEDVQRALSLKDLQVIGTIDKIMLVENQYTGETYVLKVLHKCGAEYKHTRNRSKSHLPPLLYNCRNVVKLISYIETWTGIYLLLEYVEGGRLWDFVGLKSNYTQRLQTNGLMTHSDNMADASAKRHLSAVRKSSRLLADDFDNDITGTHISAFDERNVSPVRRLTNEMNISNHTTFGKFNTTEKIDHQWPKEDQVKHWAAQIVVSLEDLHSHGILCKDLNPRNILIDSTGQVKLTFMSAVQDVDYILEDEAIDKQYCAPEVDGVFELTEAADWWSLGALLFELLTGKSLISCHPGGIQSHSIITLPRSVSGSALSLLGKLLRYNKRDRLGSGPAGVEEIKSHPFFCGINWADYLKNA